MLGYPNIVHTSLEYVNSTKVKSCVEISNLDIDRSDIIESIELLFKYIKKGTKININMNQELKNIAYIDGQNLYMGTTKSDPSWKISLAKFKKYLERKYAVGKAYYYLGYVQEGEKIEHLYEEIQSAGFILVFRQHNAAMQGKKKGNVDSDIIFSIMKRIYQKDDFNKIVLVSGDGDFKMLVDFLIEEKRLEKVLFPNKKFASSLYKNIGGSLFDYLENPGIRAKIEYKEKGPLGS